ncbi:thiamine biosynthesis protein ApbE [Pasteurellaceae bacterium RH1A]|nr:thiamine biosynthesis protein ApbE [Pasteurellaceae bacterium RH1A]
MKLKTLLALATFSLFLTACNKEPTQIALTGKTMGTTYHVKYIDKGDIKNLPKQEEVQAQLDNLLKEVNRQMSTYQNDSEISQFNRYNMANQPFKVSPDFAMVVQEAVRLNKISDGALDVTVGPLVNLWGFGPDKRLNKVPTAEQIAERSEAVGIDKIQVQGNALVKTHPNLYLDLSSIAKGAGVDKVADHLESLGIENYLVEIGGEMRGKGNNQKNEAWKIAIEKPEANGVAQIVVPLHKFALATSGNYRNYFEDEQGNRLSHIIDPKNHHPVNHNLASISVVAEKSMTADGLSTGLFVLGADKALDVAEREKLAVFLIIKNGDKFDTKMSSEFEKLIKQ